MIEIKTDFDLRKTIENKPFLFFHTSSPKKRIYTGELISMSFEKKKDKLLIETNGDQDFVREKIIQCFGLDEELSDFYELVKQDPVLSLRYEKIKNTNILSAFTNYEALLSGICSQNCTFSHYKKMVRALDRQEFNPEKITKEYLKENGFGYRAMFIKSAPPNVELSELENYFGVGKFTADLIGLFQERDYKTFYYDRLIHRIIDEFYEKCSDEEEVRKFAKKRWGKWRGLFEVYLQKFISDLKEADA